MGAKHVDDYLSSDDSPQDSLLISDLDGFLHGVACSPEVIPVEEWMVKALGGTIEGVPDWVLNDIVSMYAGIIERLISQPPVVEPIFWQGPEGKVIANDWCEGFLEAVSLRPKEWLRLTEGGEGGQMMTPILAHLVDGEGNSVLGVPAEDLDEAQGQATKAIPDAIAAMFRFWRSVLAKAPKTE